MREVNELKARIDATIAAVSDKIKQQQQSLLQEHLERQKLVKDYEVVLAEIVEIAKPRLHALAERAGDRVKVTPTLSETRRAASFEFRSDKAFVTLGFSVSPDLAVENAVVEYDLRVVPVLWRYESHAEFACPIAGFDGDALAAWLDDRIVAFIELFVKIHEGELYDKAEFVEDPVAKVRFPKFAAGATLEHGGETHYFIDGRTMAEFARQKGAPVA